MMRAFRLVALALLVTAASASAAPARVEPDAALKLYDQVTPSLVAVKFTWESELGRRELTGAGIVVGDDGLVMSAISVFDSRIPDAQMKEFKIVIPSQEKDADEIEAVFVGRDERTSLAFLRPKDQDKDGKDSGRHWKPLKFEEQPVNVGDPLLSVGLLPEAASYKTYLMQSDVSVTLRGEIPQVLVDGGLAGLGSPVFNADGKAIGLVGPQAGTTVWLNDPNNSLGSINNPPKFYTPARDFLQSLQDPPETGKPQVLPWIGVPQLTGLNKDVAEVFGLTNQPAVQVGEVIPDTPAAKAGLKQGDIIVKLNGEPLERGDESTELPGILGRKILRMKPGTEVTLGILRKRGEPLQEIKATLEPRPMHASLAKRFYAEDLGFSVRDVTFYDNYARHLPADSKGVVVALIRPQSSSQSGGLVMNDLITQLNGEPIADVAQFEKNYQQFRKDKAKEAVVLVVHREGRENTVRIEPPQ
jgi:serine protease Do